MTPAARVAAAIGVLDAILGGLAPEPALAQWARGARYAGSKDRAALRDLVFDALRRRRSYAALGGGEHGRALMLGALVYRGEDPDSVFLGTGHAPTVLSPDERARAQTSVLPVPGAAEAWQNLCGADLPGHDLAARLWPDASSEARESLSQQRPQVALDWPDWLLDPQLASAPDRFLSSVAVQRHRAPVSLRVNMRRTDPESLRKDLLEDGIETRRNPVSDSALTVISGARRVAQSRAYADGRVEIQDAGAQALCAVVDTRESGRILDLCAGAGGKSLALWAAGADDLCAYDIDPRRLAQLQPRAQRAGARIRCLERKDLTVGAFDTVLADVPCSGSGTWRRNPAEKWSFDAQRLADLNATQDALLSQAAELTRSGGMIIYATCSLLKSENDDRVQAFLSRNTGWKSVETLTFSPDEHSDGFFVARLQQTQS